MDKMKKVIASSVLLLFTLSLFSPVLVNAEEVDNSVVEISPRSTSGYLYKNGKITSYKQTSRKFVGTVDKGSKTWIKGKIEGYFGPAKLSLELGTQKSTSMKAKRYKVTGKVTSTYDRYGRYANKKIDTVTFTNNVTWTEDVAQ